MVWCKAKLFFFLLLISTPVLAQPLTLHVPDFGSVTVYQPSNRPTGVVLFASGLEGWKGQVTEIAQTLAGENRLVVGFDLNAYLETLKGQEQVCFAGDLEHLAKVVEKQMKSPEFFFPALAGYAEGGNLIYAAETQAPTTFLGAVSIGFCPELPISERMCPGWGFKSRPNGDAKSVTLLPSADLRNPWIVLEGIAQPSCAAKEFVEKVPRGEFIQTDQKEGAEQVKAAIDRIIQGSPIPAPASGLSDLPLVELNGGTGDKLLILISGDGGFVSLDHEIGAYLQTLRVSVIGFDALRYFWTGRTPKDGSQDLSRILAYYLPAWKKKKAVIAGYSLGADVLPFFLRDLPEKSLDKISGVAFIGPSSDANFQAGPLSTEDPEKQKQIFSALVKSRLHLVCIGGSLEKPPSLCKKFEEDKEMSKKMDIEFLHSGHMFLKDPEPVGDMLIKKFHLR